MKAKLTMILFLLFVTGLGVFLKTSPQSTEWLTFLDKKQCVCAKRLSGNNHAHMLNSSVPPVLSASYHLSEDDFNWWARLQRERRSITTYHTTVNGLFEIFPRTPDLLKPSPDCCRTCAVVGNSGNLRGSQYGQLIDVNNVIIRMNQYKIKGYEEDVGTRTTHHVMYPESAMDLDNTTHLVFFPFKILDLEWLIKALTTGFTGRSYAPVRSKIKANKDLVMLVNPAFMKYVHKVWLGNKGSYPSTGFMTVILALHVCNKVNVFGFGADKDGNWNHYWEKLQNKHLKTGLHPGNHEFDTIQELVKQQIITFYKK